MSTITCRRVERIRLCIVGHNVARHEALLPQAPPPRIRICRNWLCHDKIRSKTYSTVRLRVRAPTTGQDMTVTVPAGVASGGLFDVPLPEPRLPSLGE